MTADAAQHDMLVLLHHDMVLLDVAGPTDVFSSANDLLVGQGQAPFYRLRFASEQGKPVTCTNGLALAPTECFADSKPAQTVLIPGGPGTRDLRQQQLVGSVLQRQADAGARIVGVCSGAFMIGAAGLLDGRRATTHWQYCDLLARSFPQARVEDKPIFVEDDSVYTSAGVSAGIDLALHLVEKDLGRRLALRIARYLVMYLRRPGHQTQFSEPLRVQGDSSGPMAKVFDWIETHLAEAQDVNRLADIACMSPRHFARRFRDLTGTTPARYVSRRRVEAAGVLLTQAPDLAVAHIARRCGFNSSEQLSRSFKRVHGIEPLRFREQFAPSPQAHR